MVKGFKTSDRGQLIMACGTGKTLAGLFIAEKLNCQRTLVLLPSLSLLKQTLNEWRANCASDFISHCRCVPTTRSPTPTTLAIAHTADLGVPVTTAPQEIAAFLRRKSGPLVGVLHLPVLTADRGRVRARPGAGIRPRHRR